MIARSRLHAAHEAPDAVVVEPAHAVRRVRLAIPVRNVKVARLNSVFSITPNDPMDEQYGSQDIQDNLRYPERSFRAGLINSGNKIITNSEVASNRMLDTAQPIQPFKPELVENGGLLDGIGADDTHTNYNYASF